MPITEIIFPTFKSNLTKEAHAVAKTAFTAIKGQPGLLHHRIGRITREDGKPLGEEWKSVLSLEWDSPTAFHNIYPSATIFQEVMKQVIPYVAAKATPLLFQPLPPSSLSTHTTSNASFPNPPHGATQLFLRETGAGSDGGEVKTAWAELVDAVNAEGKDGVVGEWEGEGIENAEGLWVGFLGWKGGVEVCFFFLLLSFHIPFFFFYFFLFACGWGDWLT
ncbi:unnamed protein product [Periconia digitata]|uniref:ABM domain-containing protein n=1 Tax=Periconia digitata TaxID=1303443 RepID=A0A9W4UP14_9PLEO|nr:unnamed protein product [Periconia digitata]